jgi:methylmalonyl-CoA mutase cobalamin-binding domain/chain
VSKVNFTELVNAIKQGQTEEGEETARALIKAGADPLEALGVVTNTLKEVGDAFSKGDIFLVHMIMASEAAKAVIAILSPAIKGGRKVSYTGRVLIGTVAGDIHDIGKRLVGTFLEMEGFEVIDLGIDVPTQTIVEKVRELKPDVLGLSALVTSTMPVQGEVIEALRKAGLRNMVKVVVGGSAVSAAWAEEVGADSYGNDAVDAVNKVKALINK